MTNTGGILAALRPKVRRRKRTSLRRWKARCRLGQEIPFVAICEYQLDELFLFIPTKDVNRDILVALAEYTKVKPRGRFHVVPL